jgi:hypothetical protein
MQLPSVLSLKFAEEIISEGARRASTFSLDICCQFLTQDTRAYPPNGKISVQAVSWTLVQKLAEPDAGLSGHKVTILNRADRSVIASGTTDSSGIVEFDVPQGTYTLLGASDEPQSVRAKPDKR